MGLAAPKPTSVATPLLLSFDPLANARSATNKSSAMVMTNPLSRARCGRRSGGERCEEDPRRRDLPAGSFPEVIDCGADRAIGKMRDAQQLSRDRAPGAAMMRQLLKV